MNIRSEMQQNIQTELDFSSTSAGEAREAGREETESLPTVNDPESPANTNRLMEEVCERENLKEALRRVKANKGSAGVDGMTVGGITDYLKQHWPAIREQLLSGTYEPKSVRRVEIPKPDGGMLALNEEQWCTYPLTSRGMGLRSWSGHPDGAGSVNPASGDAGSAAAVGPDVL
jgi:hypothetical protein